MIDPRITTALMRQTWASMRSEVSVAVTVAGCRAGIVRCQKIRHLRILCQPVAAPGLSPARDRLSSGSMTDLQTGSTTSFEDLGLDEDLLRAVHDVGYESPSPIQEQAI